MGESESGRARASKTSVERSFEFRTNVPACKFGRVVLALWPDKPALNLAQRIGCSERAALFYITGQRKVSARALVVVMDEID